LRGSPEDFLQDQIDPKNTVFLHEAPPDWIRNTEGEATEGRVAITLYSPDEIHMAVEAPTDGFVVLSEVYYPGWRAEIDGNPTKILRGDYLLRVVPVPKGPHKIRVYFSPGSLRLGAIITLLTLGTAIAAAIGNRYFRRRYL
jgi:uncharacterized membrane protein YfhO